MIYQKKFIKFYLKNHFLIYFNFQKLLSLYKLDKSLEKILKTENFIISF